MPNELDRMVEDALKAPDEEKLRFLVSVSGTIGSEIARLEIMLLENQALLRVLLDEIVSTRLTSPEALPFEKARIQAALQSAYKSRLSEHLRRPDEPGTQDAGDNAP